MKSPFRFVKGGVCAPKGYKAAGVPAAIKPGSKKRDVALIVSDFPAEVIGTFTTNQVKAAPVRVSMEHARNGKVRGIVANAGNANACNGVQGLKDAIKMTEIAAEALKLKPRDFLVCSTGRIGRTMPMDRVKRGIVLASKKLSPDSSTDAAEAIMTSDTFSKECAVSVMIDGKPVVIGGMSKGAGMIHPNMATMLCFVTTDAVIDKKNLQRCVDDAVEHTFNRISVDGDTSTNDTVLVLANGAAGNNSLKTYHPDFEVFKQAMILVMRQLSRMIVEDGEGISKVVDIHVKGAATHADAKCAATAVATSMLVKASWCGEDPNWGRLMDAIGYSKARVREELVEIFYDGILAVSSGRQSKTPMSKLKRIVKKRNFTITIHLHQGDGEYNIVATDLTEKYVELNKGE